MKRIKAWLRSELPQLLITIVLLFAVRSSLADHYYVPSGSMEYTILPGDRVLVSKLAYGLRLPFTQFRLGLEEPVVRGDIVIFDSPADGVRLIKRIVGIGGDVIALHDGHLSVNGVPLAGVAADVEIFGGEFAHLNLHDGGGRNIDHLQVPPEMVLAIGDHRGASKDGRYFGLVAEHEIYGKALGIYHRKGDGFVWKPL